MDKLKNEKLAKKGIVVRTKEEKRKEKRLKEKEKRLKKKRKSFKKSQEADEDFDDVPEKVEFNDVVQAPPTKLPGVKNNEARRPGQNKDLLFLSEQNMKVKKGIKPKLKDTKAKKKMKHKMSLAKQQMFEIDRQSIIEQYRALKQQKAQ